VEEVGDGPALEKTALARRKGKGYRADFLGFPVPLPKPNQKLAKFVQPLEPNALPKGSVKGELVYTHFSVVMHRDRKLAIFAAVNIDGSKASQETDCHSALAPRQPSFFGDSIGQRALSQ
jgi:DNA/RNA endonuclease G (NUC1)